MSSALVAMPKYDTYKSSGVEWLGDIPKHWEVMRFKFLASIKTGEKNTEDKKETGLYPFYVRSQTPERIDSYSYDGEAILTAGDGAGVGKVYHYVNGKFDYHQRVYKFSDFNQAIGKYLFRYLESNFYNVAILGTAKSTVDSLRLPLIQDFPICFPKDKKEQASIVKYIDRKAEQIDQAVAIKEQQIALLKERKQILIQNAVTRGLNPDAPMRASGVEWIGELPEHWEVKKLKFLVRIVKRIVGHEGPDVLSITQKGIKVKDIESGEGQLAMDYSKYQLVYRGDFAMNHMDLVTGWVDISKFYGVVSPDYRVFKNISDKLDDEYLLKVFQMGYTQKIFYRYGQGVSFLGRWRFPADNFKNFYIPLPPKEEQRNIVSHIKSESTKIEKAIELQQQQIDRLKEYKTTLINSAVTGKIKVI